MAAETSELKTNSPFYTHPSDHPGLLICPTTLTGDNYNEWVTSMENAFIAKRKIGFLDGTVVKPAPTAAEFEHWRPVNSMLIGWIAQSIDPAIRSTITYFPTAKELWDDLKQRFSVGNGPRILQLRTELALCRQNGAMDEHNIDCRAQGHAPHQEQLPTPLPCQCGNQNAVVTGLLNIQQQVQNLLWEHKRQTTLLQQILFHQSQQLFQTQPQSQHYDANGLGSCQLHSTPTILDQDRSMGMTRNEENGNVGVDGIPVKVYEDLLERALTIESIVKTPDRSQNSKRTLSEEEKGNIMETPANKKLATEHFSYPRCNTCFKHHLGECKMQLGLCFKCGEAGHFARKCPIPKKPTTTTDKTEGIKNDCLESSGSEQRIIEHNLAENTSYNGESLPRIDVGEEDTQEVVPTSTSTNEGKEDGSGEMNM